MSDYPKTTKNRIRQVAKRAAFDEKTVHAFLDDGYVAHIAFIDEEAPAIIPIYYVRDGNQILIHGSRKARLFRRLATGIPLSLSVTHIVALVMARSAFHHSMNYRSVILHSSARLLEGEIREKALDAFIERLEKGRSDQARRINKSEDKATMVLAIPIQNVSAKQRSGPPVDDDEDMDLPLWAGIIPIETKRGEPEQDPG